MSLRPTTTCQRCGALIWFAFSARYRRIALEPEPTTAGDYRVTRNGDGEAIAEHVGQVHPKRVKYAAARQLYRRHPRNCEATT